jgi:hypothetical protein
MASRPRLLGGAARMAVAYRVRSGSQLSRCLDSVAVPPVWARGAVVAAVAAGACCS